MLPLEEVLVSLRRPCWLLKTCSMYPMMFPFWYGVGGGAQESVTLVLVEATGLRLSGGLVGAVDIHVPGNHYSIRYHLPDCGILTRYEEL